MDRARFIVRCLLSGIEAISSVWQSVLGVLALGLAIGIGIQDHIPRTGPRWLKTTLLVALVVAVLIEGAYQQIEIPKRQTQQQPRIEMHAETINYTVIDPNALNTSPEPPPPDP